MKQYSTRSVPSGVNRTVPHTGSASTVQRSQPEVPQVHRYSHPIEITSGTVPCDAMRSILCTLANQNQVLCTIKTELDEILSLLQEAASEENE